MLKDIEKSVHENLPDYLETLKELVRIPSISFDNFDQKYVEDSANKVKQLFEEAGFQNIQLLRPPSGRATVYAESLTTPDQPTVLLYAHHDVQPPMREELWNTKPFDATIKGDRIFGRGTAVRQPDEELARRAARLVGIANALDRQRAVVDRADRERLRRLGTFGDNLHLA